MALGCKDGCLHRVLWIHVQERSLYHFMGQRCSNTWPNLFTEPRDWQENCWSEPKPWAHLVTGLHYFPFRSWIASTGPVEAVSLGWRNIRLLGIRRNNDVALSILLHAVTKCLAKSYQVSRNNNSQVNTLYLVPPENKMQRLRGKILAAGWSLPKTWLMFRPGRNAICYTAQNAQNRILHNFVSSPPKNTFDWHGRNICMRNTLARCKTEISASFARPIIRTLFHRHLL